MNVHVLAATLALFEPPPEPAPEPVPWEPSEPAVEPAPPTEPSEPTEPAEATPAEPAPTPPATSPDSGATASTTSPDAAATKEPDASTVEASAPAPTPTSRLVPKREPEIMAERKLGDGDKIVFKPGAGVTIATADKKWSLALSSYGQLLYNFEHHDPKQMGGLVDSQSLQIRRVRVFITGNLITEHIKYHLQLAPNPREIGLGKDGTVKASPLFMWHITYDRLRDLNIQAGFFFVPHSRQRYTNPAKLGFIDNSAATYEFGFDRDTGIVLKSNDLGGLGKRLRYQLGLFMGDGYDFQFQRDFGMQYIGRFEVLPWGDFNDSEESDFARLLTPKMAIGAAYSFVDNDTRRFALNGGPWDDGGTADTHNVTADVLFRIAGLSLYGDFFWRQGRRKGGGATDAMGNLIPIELSRNGIGYTAQAQYLIPHIPFEITARYDGIRPLTKSTTLTRLDEVGPGFNYYFAQHAVKLQLDYYHQFLPGGAKADRVRLQFVVWF